MKKLSSKVTLLASVLAVAGMFIVPAVRAADDDAAKAEKKKKKMEADLKKYDKNGNGKLDADEEAAMKADMEKAKAEKKKKKDGGN
jgi:capsule polysaccharide export protein KpsE/RkpR